MPDLKYTQLTNDLSPQSADIISTARSPFGASSNRKVTLDVLNRFFNNLKVLGSQDFYIDPATGNDTNAGTALSPLATLTEAANRLHGSIITGTVNIYLLGDITEICNFFVDTGFIGTINIRGTRTLVGSGRITSIQNYNITTKADQRITDSTLPTSWTASGFVGKMIVLTSGGNSGSYAFVYSEPVAKTAIVSPFYNPATGTMIEPVGGENYNIYSLTTINGAINGQGGINGIGLYDLDIEFDEVANVDPIYMNGGFFYAFGCIVNGKDDPIDPADFYGHLMLSQGCVAYVLGCWVKAHFRSNSGSYVSVGSCLFSGFGTGPTADGAGSVINVALPCAGYGEQTFLQGRNAGEAMIDTGSWLLVANQSYGLYVRDHARAQLKGKIWGYGITDFGVYMGANACVTYSANQRPDLVNNPVGPTYPTKQIDLGGVTILYTDITNTTGSQNAANGAEIVPSYITD